MDHQPVRSPSGLNRRTMLTRAGTIAAAMGFGGRLGPAAAQEATSEALAGHPIVGAWNVTTPGGHSLAVFAADGTATFASPTTAADPALGVVYQSPSVGTWEPTGPRSIHFTATWVITDANGVHLGYGTNEAYPEVSDDGQSLVDDQSRGKVTIRDAAGATVQAFATAGAPPVTGSRMGVGAPGFPVGTPAAGTPTG